MKDDREVVIVSACRTAIGSYLGTLSDLTPGNLGAIVVSEVVRRAGISPECVDEVIMGNVLSAGWGQGIARQAAVWGGIPVTTPAVTINKICGSGMKSIILGAQAIRLGDADAIVAGGVESMSTASFLMMGARKGLRMGHAVLQDSMISDGLTDTFTNTHMGITAENIAEKYQITREDQDRYAWESQQKAEKALQSKRFIDEIVPVEIPKKNSAPIVFDQDEYPRLGCTLEGLTKLKPAFRPDGTVTAGNSSGINDGAAAVLLMSAHRAKDLGIQPLACVRSYGVGAVDPAFMGLGPIPAAQKALQKAGLTVKDIQLIEANEAFAAQAIAVSRTLEFPQDIVNVNGGAIALGHPIGASGTRITVTLLHEMQKCKASLGLATLCIGGGMGTAIIFERA